MKPPLSPRQHSAFPLARAALREGSCCWSWLCQGCSEPGHCSFPAPASSRLLLCSSCLQLCPVLQLCSVGLCSVLLLKCLQQLWQVARGISLVHPSLLCSPGSASVPWFSSTRGCSLSAARPPLGISGSKANLVSHLGHRRGWGGSGSTAATRFAVQLPFPKSDVAEAKRW